MTTDNSKIDQTRSERSQNSFNQADGPGEKSENHFLHALTIVRQVGIIMFCKLSFQRLYSQLILTILNLRFILTKPKSARVVVVPDIDRDLDELMAGRENRLVEQPNLGVADRDIQFTHQDRVQEGIRAYNPTIAERSDLIEQGQKLFNNRRVLFILPVVGAGGGSNSVFLAVQAMRKMGVDAQIMNLAANRKPFLKSYPNISVPVFFGEIGDIPSLAGSYDAIVATSNTTVSWITPAVAIHPGLVVGYYIQDYEAYFYPPESEGYRNAAASYTMLPQQVRCVTTQWIVDQIQHHHGLDSHLVGGHIDTDLFRPRPLAEPRSPGQTVRIAAMIRPVSERRSPRMTMEILEQASRQFGSRLEFLLFGCEPYDPGFAHLPKHFPWQLAGELRPAQIASLMNQADIFVDYSVFQALGLAALEAMACGVASIVPANGGTGTFARPDENCLVVDTHDPSASYAALQRLIEEDALRYKLQRNAIPTAVHYYPELPAFNILNALFP